MLLQCKRSVLSGRNNRRNIYYIKN